MRKAVLILLVLSAVLVAETEAGWFRRTVRKVKDKVSGAVNKVKEFVNKHKDTIDRVVSFFGRKKRSIQGTGASQEETMANFLEELQLACPGFGISADDTVSRDVILAAFDGADENGDGSLDKTEIELFENIIETIQECIDLENETVK